MVLIKDQTRIPPEWFNLSWSY